MTDGSAPGQHTIRVISVYATKWRFTGLPDHDQDHLPLGQLEEFYVLYKDQLPQVLSKNKHDSGSLMFQPSAAEAKDLPSGATAVLPADDEVDVLSMQSWLFVLPSDQVVAAYDFTIRGRVAADGGVHPLPAIRLLERCAYARLVIDGLPLEEHVSLLARTAEATEVYTGATAEPFPPERHQIVFATRITAPTEITPETPERIFEPGDDETIKRILYRIEPPNRPEFVEYKRPSGLNHPGTLCAVTPYASLLSDHPAYLENSLFLTVVQAVGTAARFRQIWHKAHRQVREFRRMGQDETVGTQRRDSLEFLADELGNLELDLSFSVETSADLGLLIPSLRVESFHRELYAAMELRERAETVSRMFNRLDASIQSELTAIDIRDRQAGEDKRLRWGLSLGVLSFVAIPIGVLSAYFGVNASQVNPNWSIFSMRHYGWVYVWSAVLAMLPLVTWLLLNGKAIVENRRAKRRRREAQALQNAHFNGSG